MSLSSVSHLPFLHSALPREITTVQKQTVQLTVGTIQNFKIGFIGYFAHIIITPSSVGEQHWDVILTGLRISDVRASAVPSSELNELVFELAAGVLRSL